MDEKEAAKRAFLTLAGESAARGLELSRRAERRASRRRMLFCMACGAALFFLASESAPPELHVVRHLALKSAVLGAMIGYGIERAVYGRPVA
jgi:hypothetical protein